MVYLVKVAHLGGVVTYNFCTPGMIAKRSIMVASFPGRSRLQFLMLAVCKNGRGRPGRFSHVCDVR